MGTGTERVMEMVTVLSITEERQKVLAQRQIFKLVQKGQRQ